MSDHSTENETRLTDGVITLRPFRFEDIEAHVAGDDEASTRWLNEGHPSTLESTRAWIEKNQASWENGGPVFNFAIEGVTDKKLVGMIEANTDYQSIEGCQAGDANLSYSLYPSARGKGFVTRALNLVLKFLKQKGIKKVVIQVHPDNIASMRVPTRNGFLENGTVITKSGEERKIFYKGLA